MPRHCLFCLGPLPNGREVCSDECDEGWWRICPTIDGELYEAAERDQGIIPGMEPYYPSLLLPPEPHEAASARDRLYIDGARLRQRLIEANP
jgi:hypothetical protein